MTHVSGDVLLLEMYGNNIFGGNIVTVSVQAIIIIIWISQSTNFLILLHLVRASLNSYKKTLYTRFII